MGKLLPAVVVLACAVAVTGCNRSVSALDTRLPPEPLPSTPLEPVQSAQLEPLPPGQTQPADPLAGNVQGGNVPGGNVQGGAAPTPLPPSNDPNQVASISDPAASGVSPAQPGTVQGAQPASGGPSISRDALAGSWVVASDNPDCRMILSLTTWSGGYRAATRRCNSAELSSISAWDVRGSTVALLDGNGNTVGNFSSSGPERYDGSTASGLAITLSR